MAIWWEAWPVGLSFAGEAGMPSVVGLLEEHELAARRRVDGLREEADRIQAESAAEQQWQEWVVARRRVDAVLAPDAADTADTSPCRGPRVRGTR